eukprot:5888656-Prymnesium_polylepis.1
MRDRQLLESIAAVKGGRLERGAAADRELAQRRAARDVEDAEARQAVDGDGSEAVTAGEAQREEGRQLAEPAEARAAEEGGECAVCDAPPGARRGWCTRTREPRAVCVLRVRVCREPCACACERARARARVSVRVRARGSVHGGGG